MPLEGVQIQPRDITSHVAPHWPNSKVKAVATVLSESAGFIGAYHDNEDGTRDCGFFQINIPQADIGTDVESNLRTDDTDPSVYLPVLKNNIDAAYNLYEEAWTRNGKQDVRRWEPWYGYTSGLAMFTAWWVWAEDATGNPIGPWEPTGRYLHRAIRGVANWHLRVTEDMTGPEAVAEAERLAQVYGVENGGWYYGAAKNLVYYTVPSKPVNPPADGVGPRPIPNSGI